MIIMINTLMSPITPRPYIDNPLLSMTRSREWYLTVFDLKIIVNVQSINSPTRGSSSVGWLCLALAEVLTWDIISRSQERLMSVSNKHQVKTQTTDRRPIDLDDFQTTSVYAPSAP